MWAAILGLFTGLVDILNKILPNSKERAQGEAKKEYDKNDSDIDKFINS